MTLGNPGCGPIPKPVRPKKPTGKDPASFHTEDVSAVYETIRCFQTAKQWSFDQPVDPHHVLGRGSDETRWFMCSVLNLAWLRRDIHHGPLRDASDQRRVYLRLARERVQEAVTQGRYRMQERDFAFLAYVDEWTSAHPA